MTVDEIKEFVKQSMIDNITSVLKGEKEEVKLIYVRPNDIIDYMESIGGTYTDSLETNGWEWDYWFDIEYENKIYSISGDGYYRNGASFSLKEDE